MLALQTPTPLSASSLFTCKPAGDVYNTLAAAARLGSVTAFLTRLAQDDVGALLLHHFEASGLDTRWVIQTPDGHNGLYLSLTDPGQGHRFLYYRRQSEASRLNPSDLPAANLPDIRLLYATGITQALSPSSRQLVKQAFQQARRIGILTAYDPNWRPALWSSASGAREAFLDIAPFLDMMLPSMEDMAGLFGVTDPDTALHYLTATKIPLIALKQGADGVTLQFQGEQQHLKALSPMGPMWDTIGAGDAFNGGFLHSVLQQQHSLATCAHIGMQTALQSLAGLE
jgi:2-dehydro-3-deoxygluconokinase